MFEFYEEKAKEARKLVLEMLLHSNSGHPGSSLSSIETLVSLYFGILELTTENKHSRDKFILSKGHAAPALYAVMMLKGLIDEKEKYNLRKGGSCLQGHPDERFLPILDFSSGSLGQNLSVGVGMALGQKLASKKSKTYVLLGDGEIQEGQIWEAALSAPKFSLNNLTAIIDHNKLQLDGPLNEIMNLGNIRNKWESFGWDVIEIDGHDFEQLFDAFQITTDKPKCILANTIKGKGVPFMENIVEWHSLHNSDSTPELKRALELLGG